MNILVKEFLYFFLTLLTAFLFCVLIFGLEELKSGELVLNIHDTYLVISTLDFLIVFVPIIVVITYLIRMGNAKFKNLTSNAIFIIFNGFLILLSLSVLLVDGENEYKMNYKFWLLVTLSLILEFYVIFKSITIRNGTDA